MNKGKCCLVIKYLLFSALLICFSQEVKAGEPERSYEIVIGVGTDLFGWGETDQLLLAPAVSWGLKGHEGTRLRIEGDIEFMDYYEHQFRTDIGIFQMRVCISPMEVLILII